MVGREWVRFPEKIAVRGFSMGGAGTWSLVPDATAAGGTRMWNPDKSAGKIRQPLPDPQNYFEISFQAEARVAYAGGAPPALPEEKEVPQKYAERLAKLRQGVVLHEKNIEALKKELAATR